MEVLKAGTELHLASFCLADAELLLEGADDPMFATLKAQYCMLCGAQPGMLPYCCMELELETGHARMVTARIIPHAAVTTVEATVRWRAPGAARTTR